MIPRQSAKLAATLAEQFKILAIIGPRQAGKTTLAQAVFPDRPYVSLETPDEAAFARDDPLAFFSRFPEGAIIDEAQRCPHLFSYLQGIVDATRRPGQFILTGSQHFGLMEGLTQSLAGRVGFLRLLPLSLGEIQNTSASPKSLKDILFSGGYPPLYDQPVTVQQWLDAYITTYTERDVRQVANVQDLNSFQLFLRLCAGNVGQLLNLSRIGNDVGVSHNTIHSWIGILETSFILFRLQPHHTNFRKRLVKTPKFYFYDTGLAARLLGIESPDQLMTHSSRGALFENWVITEFLKGRSARGKRDNFFFWRSNIGNEIDLVAEQAEQLMPVEIKSGATIAPDWLTAFEAWLALAGSVAKAPHIVYGGEEAQSRKGIRILPWRQIASLADNI
jgi:uncharacterized protein